jgi:hypothetical protein
MKNRGKTKQIKNKNSLKKNEGHKELEEEMK